VLKRACNAATSFNIKLVELLRFLKERERILEE
jgi:hypothetical protein